MSTLALDDLREAPWSAYAWNETVHSIDGADTALPTAADVAVVLAYGEEGDHYDGFSAAVVRLRDGRLVAWESIYGPTGSGFNEDAYGGDAEVWFAPGDALRKLVTLAMGDAAREACGFPREGFPLDTA